MRKSNEAGLLLSTPRQELEADAFTSLMAKTS